MKKIITVTAVGAAVTLAAIAGGAGAVLAHGDHDNMGDHSAMMGGTMTMDPAAMQDHMKQVMGDGAYQVMQDAMKQALGEDGYQQMLDRMAAGCSGDMGSMMTGTPGSSSVPGHDSHHPSATGSN